MLIASTLSVVAWYSPKVAAVDPTTPIGVKQQVLRTLGAQPLTFEENRGQFDDAIRFVARGAGYGISLTDTHATVTMRRQDDRGMAAVRMSVVGARPDTTLRGEAARLEVIRRYRGGASPFEARTQRFDRVSRASVYDGIDLVYYGNQRQLEYDFVVAPGRDPQAIRLQFDGASRLEIDEATGDLLLHVEGGEPVRQHKPITYQTIAGTRHEVSSRYVITSATQVRFEVGRYDRSQPLVIDPTLVYSTYFGGTSEEEISDIALDAAGNIYVTGRTSDTAGYPTTPGAIQPTKPGAAIDVDAFVAKFNPTGTALIYSTFLGGTAQENHTEHMGRLAVDAAGNAYITGTTLSADFPVTPNADDNTFGGSVAQGVTDAFYTKLSPTGAMIYSTFIGGTDKDVAYGVAVDTAGNVYIDGYTKSDNTAEGFVTTANAYDSTLGNGQDAFLVKFDATNVKVYATYLGGNNGVEGSFDFAGGIACDNNGRAYLIGDTWATDFPIVNGFQPIFGGQYDAFVAVIDTTKVGAAGLVYSSYMGGPSKDVGYAVAFAGNGQFVVVGEAMTGFPVKNALQAFGGGPRDAFIARIDSTQNGAPSLLWSTFYGGNAYDYFADVIVDANGDIHIAGETGSTNFPLANAIRSNFQQYEPVVLKINGAGNTLGYATFYGSNTNKKAVRSVAANAAGETYFGGWTWHAVTNPPDPDGFPIRNAYQSVYGGGDADGLIGKIGYASDVQLTMTATPEPVTPNTLLTYTLSVVNAGSDPTGSVVVSDALPNDVTFQNCTATAGGVCGGTGNARTITFAGLGPNAIANITLLVRVNGGLAPNAAFMNTGTLAVSSADTNPANNTANVISHTPSLQPTGDDDGDGLPNGWEALYGVDPWGNDPTNGANGDPDGDGKTNLQEYQQGSHPRGFVITYFAEGATGSFFDTRFAVANPGNKDALVLLRFQRADGVVIPHYVRVGAHSRATVDAAQVAGMESAAFSTIIESDEQVVADRTMMWDKSHYGSHAERGTLTRTATTWYLAEGATHGNFSLFYLIQNPGDTPAQVEITFLLPAPQPPVVVPLTIPAHTRYTLPVDEVPGLEAAEMSGVVRSTNGAPIVVERAMYLNTPNQAFAGGTGAAGVTDPATRWFLAEGATGSYFDMFILIGNPMTQKATVEMTYLLPDGRRITKTHDVAGLSRMTINVEEEDVELKSAALSTIVTSTNGVPVVVERVMWWPGPTAASWTEAHDSFGETTTGTKWAMAEGESGGPDSTQTYVLIANTSDFAGRARVTLLFEDGTTTSREYDLLPTSRTNVSPADQFPEADNKRYGIIVESLGGTPAQVVVERAMYSSANGVTWAAGTNSVATRLQ